MATSYSGTLRMRIGPAKSRLQSSFDKAVVVKQKPIPDTSDDLKAHIVEIEDTIGELKARVDALVVLDNRWLDLIRDLTATDLPDEESRYETTMITGGVIELMTDATEINTSLEIKTKRAEKKLVKTMTGNASTANVPTTAESFATASLLSKLPDVRLPVYDGDPLKFKQFMAIHNSNVGKTDLDPIVKYTYLLDQVEAVAKQAIEGLEIDASTYEIALTILKERFEKENAQLVGSLYSQLMRIPQSSDQSKDLRRTHDECETILRSLKAAGQNLDANTAMSRELLAKYPKFAVREVLRRHRVTAASTITDIQGALKRFLDESELMTELYSDIDCWKKPADTKSDKKSTKPSYEYEPKSNVLNNGQQMKTIERPSTTLVMGEKANASKAYNGPPAPCHLCGGNHFNAQCESYSTAADRKQRLEAVGRCGRCFGIGHSTENCRTKSEYFKCFYCRDEPVHKSALCPKKFPSEEKSKAPQSKEKNAEAQTKPNSICALNISDQSILPVVTTTVINPENGKRKKVKAFLDSASHRSFILTSTTKELGVKKTHNEKLSMAIFGSRSVHVIQSSRVKLELTVKSPTKEGTNSFSLWLNTSDVISDCEMSVGNIPEEAKLQIDSMQYAMANDPNDDVDDRPEILIGTDYMWNLVGAPIQLLDSLFVLPTKFGLTLTGSYESNESRLQPTLCVLTERRTPVAITSMLDKFTTESKCIQSEPDIDEFVALEKIGITEDPIASEDENAQEQFDSTVYMKDKRYYVCWPWNGEQHKLQSNYQMATKRFSSLAKRLKQCDKTITTEYAKVIDNQSQLGIIERVPQSELLQPKYLCHYLSHHPVIRSDHLTTKLRIVFDASSKTGSEGKSLNECMYRGPVILPEIPAILLRFRLNPVACVGDIEKAFLQLALQHSERDVTRFLWFQNPQNPDPNQAMVYRFARVPFGVIASPSLLGSTTNYHLKQDGTVVAGQLCQNTYVDNIITGAEDDKSAVNLVNETIRIFEEASMNVREWCSNSEAVMNVLHLEKRCIKRTVKVLGMKWDSQTDVLSLQGKWEEQKTCSTKREVLKSIASIYDPLGLYQPVTLQAKCFLRQLWNKKLSWDEAMPENFRSEWRNLHAKIAPIFYHTLPRHIGKISRATRFTLAAFCDASADAYAVVVYLRYKSIESSSRHQCQLLYARSRLAPKSTSKTEDIPIPKLELLGLYIASLAAKFVRESLCGEGRINSFIFCDSTIALGWLRSEKPMPVFVKNRVMKIRELEDVEYHHVSGTDNPADVCTRGLTGIQLTNSTLWWEGPGWLALEPSEWPTYDKITPFTSESLKAQKSELSRPICLAAGEEGQPDYPCGLNPDNFSSWRKLVRFTAILVKFIKLTIWDRLTDETKSGKQSLGRLFNGNADDCYIQASDYAQARELWIKSIQKNEYYELCCNAISDAKPHQLIKQLNPYIDRNGIIRCDGRLQHSPLTFDAIRPKLLPKNNLVTVLIIKDAHEKLLHAGVAHVLSEIRRLYWIPHGRNQVRRVITKCILCRKQKGPPFALTKMPPWPRERVSKCEPFQFTGVDYFGPMNILAPCQHEQVSQPENTRKMWACLFTCLSTRAVHLEFVLDCTPQAFVDCLSRFISRRGAPELVISDNAPQFRLSKDLFDRTWHKVLTDPTVRSYISSKGLTWKFTTALAPWQGGAYERLVGICKTTFRAAIGRRLLKFEEFITLICEVEAIVNSRPITYVHSDINSGLALRPVDFLTHLSSGTPEIDPTTKLEGGDASRNLTRYWKAKQKRLDATWQHFYDHYLLSLRERGQLVHRNRRGDIQSHSNENEVVLVKNADAPRGRWKLGKIIRIIPSRDGSIRSVELLLPNKQTIQRSVGHIYPLEIPAANGSDLTTVQAETDRSFEGFDKNEADDAQTQLQFLDNLTPTSRNAVAFAAQSSVLLALTEASCIVF